MDSITDLIMYVPATIVFLVLLSAIIAGAIQDDYNLEYQEQLYATAVLNPTHIELGEYINVKIDGHPELTLSDKIYSTPACAVIYIISIPARVLAGYDKPFYNFYTHVEYPRQEIQYTGIKDGKYEFYLKEQNRFTYVDKSYPIFPIDKLSLKVEKSYEDMSIDIRWVKHNGEE